MMRHPLGRKPSPVDTRDFRLSAFLPALRLSLPRRARLWEFHEHTLDQGNTSHCTGFTAAHWRISAPVKEKLTKEIGHRTYYAIKETEGEALQEDGATMRGLARTLLGLGLIRSYAFAASVAEVKRYVLDHGPIMAGTLWTAGMFDPSSTGIIRPTGEVLGGHAWLIRGFVGRGLFSGMSSWGEGWGVRGNFYIHEDDLGYLLRTGGEFVACMQQGPNPQPLP